MILRAMIIGALILSASCDKSEGSQGGSAAPGGSAGSAAQAGSGFSADLARELGDSKTVGKLDDQIIMPEDEPDKGVGKAAGSAAKPDDSAGAKAGSSAAQAGSAAKAGETASAGATASAGDAAAAKLGSTEPRPPAAPPSRGPVKIAPGLAAIKLSLLPNWDRDVDEAGTFQYVVRIKGTQNTKTFSFHYGYDDPKAPTDRDQYKRYLQDSKRLVGEIKDRQRGAAWFLEGSDGSGAAFRYVVLYGGKRLICYGSLYRDADSNRLGDDRDQTVIQAKQICETLAL